MDGKLFDVIIPYYNKGEYILRAIESIDTNYVNNIFIIDDFSKKNIAANFKASNIKYIRLTQNKGPSFCRNYGAKQSTSRYILFLDADDYYQPLLFKRLYTEIKNHEFPLIISWKIKKISSHQLELDGKSNPAEIKDRFYFISEKLRNQQVMTSSSFCISRTLYLSEGGFNEQLRNQEDPELFCRLSQKNKILFIPNTYSYYDISIPDSLSKINLVDTSLPLYVDNLLKYNNKICLELFKADFIKFYLLSLIEKKHHHLFLNKKYINNFSLPNRIILKLLPLIPSYFFKKLYTLFRYAKYKKTK